MELTEEEYDLTKMKRMRYEEIEKAREGKHWGIALGTLGRQGNEKILDRLKEILAVVYSLQAVITVRYTNISAFLRLSF